MSPETSTSPTKLCPTCGTRLSENATRCLVCGSEISQTATARSAKTVQGSRMPEVTLSLPAALGLLALFVTIGAVLVFFVLKNTGKAVAAESTPTMTASVTPTVTLTATATSTATIEPTWTPLPPTEYTVAQQDTCSSIAAFFKTSVNAIVAANNLGANCTIYPGTKLLIPQPTPTASPQPSATMNAAQSTEQACGVQSYTVQSGDTISGIARNFNISIASIKAYNGLPSDDVREGQELKIPLCERAPTTGPTPTNTPPPPYLAPQLLLPADGAPFSLSNDSVTLQWASVGTLRENEAYAVTIEDVTEGTGRKLTEYVSDTKFIVPAAFRPADATPHVMRWWVIPVRQVGTNNADSSPVWEPAGASSVQRVFTWSGTTGAQSTPNP